MRLLGMIGVLLLPGCLRDWDRDGLIKSEDCNDLDGEDTRQAWYRDADLDGYGDPNSEVLACLWPVNWVANGFDCDDEKPKYYPGAEDDWYDGEDSNCDELNDYDRDRDGFVRQGDGLYVGGSAPGEGDCDDNDPGVFPGAVEVWYDSVDADCDGKSDYDADGDSYSSQVYGGDDCDDTDAAISPGLPESCSDGIDTNCDGYLGTRAYLDADGDGYGDPDLFIEACMPPEGYASSGDDCSDDDPLISPGAPEVCGNGVDDNCDGEERICGPFGEGSLSGADARIYRNDTRARAGGALASPGDIDGDGLADLLVGSETGSAWLVSGASSGDLVELAYASFSGTDPDAGVAVGSAGDFNGDGTPDVVIGGNYDADGVWAWIVPGPFSGAVDLDSESLATMTTTVGVNGRPTSLTSGDYNDDGLTEVVLGRPGVTAESSVYLLAGGSEGAIDDTDHLAQITADFESELGYAVVGGEDYNGDGMDDLLIGAPADGSGKVYLMFGPLTGAVDALDADTLFWRNTTQSDRIGEALDAPGDLNGDGAPDILVGAPGTDGARGAVYVLGGFNGSVYDVTLFPRIDGPSTNARLGGAVLGAGDLDSDGFADLIAGSPDEIPGQHGTVYIFRGPVTATLSAADADGTFRGADDDYRGGAALAAPGDLDGDGLPDIAIGAPGADVPANLGGEVYLFFGAD